MVFTLNNSPSESNPYPNLPKIPLSADQSRQQNDLPLRIIPNRNPRHHRTFKSETVTKNKSQERTLGGDEELRRP